ncbi:MAG: hypothetical protein ACO22O_13185 [bacterium]
MKTSLRLLCGVLLTAFALSGCAEQILDSASKDPAPTVTSGEESTAKDRKSVVLLVSMLRFHQRASWQE